MKEKENNEVIINAVDFKFTDFSNSVITRSIKENQDKDWFVKLRELDAKIHSSQMVDKINLTDDRLVLVAYKTLIKTDVFDASAGIREWWIVKRYLEIYEEKTLPFLKELQIVINRYIGFTFSNAQADEAQKAETKIFLKSISEVVYEDGYVQLPEFVLNVITGKETKKTKTKKIEYDFNNDEAAQWVSLKETASIILEDKQSLTEEEIKMWEEAASIAEIMLEK